MERAFRSIRRASRAGACLLLLLARTVVPATAAEPRGSRAVVTGGATPLVASSRPAPCPEAWLGLLGRYGGDDGWLIRERDGRLELVSGDGVAQPLEPEERDVFRFGGAERHTLSFSRDESGHAQELTFDRSTHRRQTTFVSGRVFRISPRRPVDVLRREALVASPPGEEGPFRRPELVELVSLDPTLRLDVRYATGENFLGVPVYESPRAFLQRPAAEALVRAHRALGTRGYGLLVHDAYRPWWVTKVFWEATPPDKRAFVADPDRGSRHNRGCAVDLTLFRLADGNAVEMPGVYDEMSERSYPDYPGGTSLQRWHRDLLRSAMEGQGFTVFESEWWHFDHEDWGRYPILNVPFEALAAPGNDDGARGDGDDPLTGRARAAPREGRPW